MTTHNPLVKFQKWKKAVNQNFFSSSLEVHWVKATHFSDILSEVSLPSTVPISYQDTVYVHKGEKNIDLGKDIDLVKEKEHFPAYSKKS